MKNLFLAYMLINAVHLTCDQSCFLGNNLYSAPLDINHCCLYKYKKNCENFIPINDGGFICSRCKIGFKFNNNECVQYDNEEICINPSIITLPFYPCKVCRVSNGDMYAPKINKTKAKYDCVKIDQTRNAKTAKMLANCKASTLVNGAIYCYECENNYAFQYSTRTCQRINKKTKLKGCMMAFDSLHCLVCHAEYQLDFTRSICILRSQRVDVKSYMKKMEVESQKQMEMMQQQQNMQPQMQNRYMMDMQGDSKNNNEGMMAQNNMGDMPGYENQLNGMPAMDNYNNQQQAGPMGNMGMQREMMGGGYGGYGLI